MLILDNGKSVPGSCKGGVVAIGNFDGLHRGHQQLLRVAETKAKEIGAPWGMVTFEPHPRAIFRPGEPFFRITPITLKCRLAAGLGAGFTDVVTFDKALAGLSPEEFVSQKLVDRLGVQHVVTGYDFHFGRGRKGSPDTMKSLGADAGFGVTVVDQVTDDDGLAPFSSSSVRSELRRGKVSEAAHQLGYWWPVIGEVVNGDKRGRTIGFPTANIVLDAGCEPAEGIYAVRVRDAGKSDGKAWQGAGYVGKRPTFNTERLFLEVFLLDFEGDLYGKMLMIDFIDYIRPDTKFSSPQELIDQMNRDCAEIRRRLDAVAGNDPMTEFALGALQAEGKL